MSLNANIALRPAVIGALALLAVGITGTPSAWAGGSGHAETSAADPHAGHGHGAAHAAPGHAAPGHATPGHGATTGAPAINWFDCGAWRRGEGAPLIASLINFALLVFLLVRFVRRPLSGYLAARHIKIKDDLESAAKLKKDAEERLATIDAKLDNLDREIADIKDAVAKDAEHEKDRIIETARRDATALLASTERTLAVEIERAKRQLEVTAVQAALQSAEKLLRKEMKSQDYDRLSEEYFEQIEQAGGGN